MMYNLHLFLGHVVADHAFTNNAKIRKYRGLNLLGHMVWSGFAILAFTFDVLLKSALGITVLLTFTGIHILGDYLRTLFYRKGLKNQINYLELSMLIIAFVFNWMVSKSFDVSYLSSEFVFYLLGMSVVSVGVTYFFRNFYPKEEELPDVDGISERLAIFVFFLANEPLLVLASIGLGFLYRLWRYRKPSFIWYVSPISGLLISFVWYIVMYR